MAVEIRTCYFCDAGKHEVCKSDMCLCWRRHHQPIVVEKHPIARLCTVVERLAGHADMGTADKQQLQAELAAIKRDVLKDGGNGELSEIDR